MNATLQEVSIPRPERGMPSTDPMGVALSSVPRHPGRYLQERLHPLGITQTQLAIALRVSRRRVNELIRGRRGITPDTALRLATFVGHDAMYWMQLQVAWDLHLAAKAMARDAPSPAPDTRTGARRAGHSAD